MNKGQLFIFYTTLSKSLFLIAGFFFILYQSVFLKLSFFDKENPAKSNSKNSILNVRKTFPFNPNIYKLFGFFVCGVPGIKLIIPTYWAGRQALFP